MRKGYDCAHDGTEDKSPNRAVERSELPRIHRRLMVKHLGHRLDDRAQIDDGRDCENLRIENRQSRLTKTLRGITYDRLKPSKYSPCLPHAIEPTLALVKLCLERSEEFPNHRRLDKCPRIVLRRCEGERRIEDVGDGVGKAVVDRGQCCERNERTEPQQRHDGEEDVRARRTKRRVPSGVDSSDDGRPGLCRENQASVTTGSGPTSTHHRPATEPQGDPDERIPTYVPAARVNAGDRGNEVRPDHGM